MARVFGVDVRMFYNLIPHSCLHSHCTGGWVGDLDLDNEPRPSLGSCDSNQFQRAVSRLMKTVGRCEPPVSGRVRPSEVMRLTWRTAKVSRSETSDGAGALRPTGQQTRRGALASQQRGPWAMRTLHIDLSYNGFSQWIPPIVTGPTGLLDKTKDFQLSLNFRQKQIMFCCVPMHYFNLN